MGGILTSQSSRVGLNNIICVERLEMLGRKAKGTQTECREFFIFVLSIAFSPVPFSVLRESGAAHVASELYCSEIVLSECKVLFEWSFMPGNNGS